MIKKITLTSMLVLFVFCMFAKEYKQNAIAYLKKNQTELKLSAQDIADLIVVEDVLDDYTNINRVWMQQSINGIVLKNGLISVHFKDGKVVNSTNSGVYDLKKQIASTTPSLSAKDAVIKAASHVGITNVGSLNQHGKAVKNEYIFEPAQGLSNIEIHAQLAISRDKNNKAFLSWIVQFHTLDGKHFWNIDVNATDGSFINKYDQILHCEFGKGNFLGSQGTHQHSHTGMSSYIGTPSIPQGATDDVAQPTVGAYRVYRYSIESPLYGSRTLISNPDDAVASPFGWHDENGVAGAEFTTTRGNNVNVYADKDGNNSADPGSAPDGTASLNFDFGLDFNTQLDTFSATSTNSKAIVTQLFYMNNIIHDVMFKNGFTDANRNFQVKNYVTGNTATDGDPVNAEAHDGSGTNNANFSTAPDGQNSAFSRSRMQMFMWDGAPPVTLTFNAPASIAGVIDSIGTQSSWGPCNFNVTGQVANATSATAPPSFVCGAVNNPASIAGKIALIDRGNCNFSEKVLFAQQAGAIGVIIINRESAGDSLLQMAAGTNASGVTIPAVIVKYHVGQMLRNNLGTANVTLFRQSTTNCLELDGSLDNGIVAHEYGHGISTRLTGFSTGTGGTFTCLSNVEQAGEGWSDFFALALTQKPSDTKNTLRGIGNYAAGGTATDFGIRRFPYCYDMSVNPQTYGDLNDEEDIYLNGEIWCSTIWDMYWDLVEAQGYTADLYNGTGGNVKALKLVIEGLKQQPCNPGLLDSRNAILKADSILYNKANTCLIWKAFARRGLGASALQGLSTNPSDQTEAFNLPAACNTSPSATASFTANDTVVCIGGSLTFTSTSTASVGSPDSVRWTIAGGTPSTSTLNPTVIPTFNTAGTFIVSLVAYKSGNASVAATKSIRVKPLPTVNVSQPIICSGLTANPVVSSGTGLPATSFSWTGGLSPVSNPITPVLTTTTTYTVTGTRELCTATAVSTVTVNASPTTAVGTPTAICSGTAASLTASGATSYTWSPNIGLTATVSTGVLTTTTTYTVTGTTGTCSKTATVTVTVTPLPNVGVNSPSVCSGGTATLNATNATSYTWSPNIGSTASVTTPPLTTTTTYTVTGTASGCTKTAVSTVTVTAPPVVTINSVSPICSGSSASLTANGATSYTWSPNIGTTATVSTGTLTTTTTYTVTGTTGCSGTASVTVVVNPSPNVTISSVSPICSGSTASLQANNATSYTWTGGLSSVANPTTPSLTTTTTYTVSGTASGCTGTATVTVAVNALPTVNVTSPTICSGSTAQPVASGTSTSYTWTGGLAGVSNPTTTVLTTTTSYTVTGSNGTCSKTAVSTVTVTSSAPTVTITPNPASVCSGDQITLTGNGANNYTWTSSLTGTTTGSTLALSPTANTTVNLSGTLSGCSTPGTTSITVTVKAKPATATITQNSLSDTLYSSSIVAGATYEWYKSNVLTATTNTPYYVITSNGVYTVKVISLGCTSVVSSNYNAIFTAIRTNSNSIQLFEVYPNPTDGRLVMNLNLTKSANVQISMYTPEGREIYMKAFTSTRNVNEELNLNEYSKGIYIIKLKVDDETFYHKVVKQ